MSMAAFVGGPDGSALHGGRGPERQILQQRPLPARLGRTGAKSWPALADLNHEKKLSQIQQPRVDRCHRVCPPAPCKQILLKVRLCLESKDATSDPLPNLSTRYGCSVTPPFFLSLPLFVPTSSHCHSAFKFLLFESEFALLLTSC